MKNIVPICDEGDLSNDRNSPLICSDFRSIRQDEEQRDFDDSAKRKIQKQNQKEEHKKKTKTIVINWQNQFQCLVLSKQTRGYNPKFDKGLN